MGEFALPYVQIPTMDSIVVYVLNAFNLVKTALTILIASAVSKDIFYLKLSASNTVQRICGHFLRIEHAKKHANYHLKIVQIRYVYLNAQSISNRMVNVYKSVVSSVY